MIPFRTILADLIARTEVNRNYDKSDLLQIIRVLKNYEFFKEPQMELFRTRRRGKRAGEGLNACPGEVRLDPILYAGGDNHIIDIGPRRCYSKSVAVAKE